MGQPIWSPWSRCQPVPEEWMLSHIGVNGLNLCIWTNFQIRNINPQIILTLCKWVDFSIYVALWATAYLEYKIPILLKMDDLWSYKIIFKQFKQKKQSKNVWPLVKKNFLPLWFSFLLSNLILERPFLHFFTK